MVSLAYQCRVRLAVADQKEDVFSSPRLKHAEDMAEALAIAGVTLAVIPLIIAALENFEYTLQPVLIFSRRYKQAVAELQSDLEIQRISFENECVFLLNTVTTIHGQPLLDEVRQEQSCDTGLERLLEARLEKSYDACSKALKLVRDVLSEIVTELKDLPILLPEVR